MALASRRIAVIVPVVAALSLVADRAAALPPNTANAVWGQSGSFTTGSLNDGSTVSANGFNHTQGIVIDGSGDFYVCDTSNNRVLYFAAGSTTATRVYGQGGVFTTGTVNKGGISATSLGGPVGVALDSSGNLYVADKANNRVLYFASGSTTATRVYGQQGSFTTSTANKGGSAGKPTSASLSAPTGVAVDSSGNVYVTDSSNNRVVYFASGSTTATRVYGQNGSFLTNAANNGGIGAATLSRPIGVALDSGGNLYVADNGNNRALYFASASTTATVVWGQAGSFTGFQVNQGNGSGSPGATTLNNPASIAVDARGNVYIGDEFNNRVLYYASGSTTATQVYGQGGSFGSSTSNDQGLSAGSLIDPFVALDSWGDLYVSDDGNARVLEFSNPAFLSISTTHSTPIYQGGPGTITLTVANLGGPTAGGAVVADTLTSDFTINSVSTGCSISGQTVTCTLGPGITASFTAFTVYVTASTSASTAGISNAPTLTDVTDPIGTATGSDTITIGAQLPQVDSSLTQVMLSGSTDNGACASGNMTLTATDTIQNTSGSTINNPYAQIVTLSGGNTLISQSAGATSVAASDSVTFTFHIELASCATFQLLFDVFGN